MALFKNIIEYGTIFISIWTLVVITNEVLREFQKHRYRLNKFGKMLKFFYIQDRTQVLYPLLIACFFLDRWYVQLLTSLYLSFLIVWKWLQKSEPTEAYGNRLKRLFVMMVVIDTVTATVLHRYLPLPQLPVSVIILMMITPFMVLLGALILVPLEFLIKKGRLRKRD
ncbi:MAG TPA: hypothetical protein PLO88_05540 [Bacilli bacterium]|nr:MAG: hypothetical protein BWY97_00552 [Tenericutes bacterium ADurb.BinA124]HNZ50420.1 hypothetical protein [Bacilli bacterium]HPN61574.1 hypothetical protein [Bacilli bacterium]HPX84006.1 hypothetical protein [Bacilli bacterium]HQC74106.1 hypothetical protein [Bacilli bacterium]